MALRTGGSHNHHIHATRVDDEFVLTWTVFVKRGRLQDPITHRRDTNRAGAERFAKKWGVPMPTTSYKPEVLAQGEWCSNGLRFATKEESDAYAHDLLMRWFVPTDYRSVPCNDPVTHVWVDGKGLRDINKPEGSERMPARSVTL